MNVTEQQRYGHKTTEKKQDLVTHTTMCNCRSDRESGLRIRSHHPFPCGNMGSTATWSHRTESVGPPVQIFLLKHRHQKLHPRWRPFLLLPPSALVSPIFQHGQHQQVKLIHPKVKFKLKYEHKQHLRKVYVTQTTCMITNVSKHTNTN
jgi:hypothetical protein